MENYKKADEERKHKPDLNEAMTLRTENVRVPLATVIQRNRNMNPPPVSTIFGSFGPNDTLWDAMIDGLKPRVLELLDGYVILDRCCDCRPFVCRLSGLLIHRTTNTDGSTGTSSVPCT